MKHNFEERKQNRIDNATAGAARNARKSKELFRHANKMAEAIPMGQPILVGHHSEKRDRNYRSKIHNTFGKAIAASKTAEYYKTKAETIQGNTAIFSDDPDALTKLKGKLQLLETLQSFMKAANKCVKKNDKEAFLKIPSASERIWNALITPDCMNSKGFPSYKLTNNNATINNTKKRIAQLERQAVKTSKEEKIKDMRLIENVEANRVQLFFPGKPADDMRKQLKANGFRWCRTEGAWQRHLNTWAVKIGRDILNSL